MSVLLEEIRRFDPTAASVLEGADVRTDLDIQFLSREDLQDLFPEKHEFKRRKNIFDIIHKQKPVDVLLKELRGFIPSESLKAALTGNGVLVDYLRILKNMKTQMDNVQTFLDAHINLLEDISKPEPNQELQNESESTTAATTGPMGLSNNQPYDGQQGAYGSQLNTSASGGPMETDLNQHHECQQGAYGSQSNTSASGGPVEPDLNQHHERQQVTYGSQLNTSASGGPMETDLIQRHERQQGTYGSQSSTSASGGPEEHLNQPHEHQQGTYGSQSNTSASSGPMETDLNQRHERQQGTYGSQSNTSASGRPEEHYLNQHHEHQQQTYGSKSNTSASGGPQEHYLNHPHERQKVTHGSKSPTHAMAGQGKPYKNQTDPRALGSRARLDASGEKWYHLSPTGNIFNQPSQHLQEVKYRVVVSGETFGAHVQLMEQIKASSQDRKLQLVESSQDPQIIFVFCPIVSRLATDANAALEDVKDSPGDASIILVLMHHVHEVKMVTHLRTWDEVPNVALYVHVFYHEKARGLLKCRENKDAVSKIQSRLLEMHPCKHISASAPDQSSTAGSFPGGGDNSGSQNDRDNNSGSNYLQKIPGINRLFSR